MLATPACHTSQLNNGLVLQLDISADRFVRTTNPAHERLVAALLQKVHDQGDIYKATYEGHYCVGCESYKDDGEMTAGHICPIHRTECKLRHEENHFFRLSKCACLASALV